MTCKSDGHRLESKTGDILRPAKTKVTPTKVDLTTLTKAVPIPAPLQERNHSTYHQKPQAFLNNNASSLPTCKTKLITEDFCLVGWLVVFAWALCQFHVSASSETASKSRARGQAHISETPPQFLIILGCPSLRISVLPLGCLVWRSQC